jgi:hypothetical protein
VREREEKESEKESEKEKVSEKECEKESEKESEKDSEYLDKFIQPSAHQVRVFANTHCILTNLNDPNHQNGHKIDCTVY